jgi:hypothetical protein
VAISHFPQSGVATQHFAKENLNFFCNVKMFLGLICILPLFECKQFLSKFVQARDVFICDFIDIVKACERDLYRVYVDAITSHGYGDGIFKTFLVIANHTYDPLHTVWIVDLIYGVEYARFFFFPRTYMVHKKNPLISCLNYVSKLDCLNVIKHVKQQLLLISFKNLNNVSQLETS